MTLSEGLLERAKGGDRAAFEELFTPHAMDAFRLAVAMLQRREDAEDAVQNAMLKAWRRLGTFRTGCDVRPWFLTIVANECRSLRRSRWWSVVRLADLYGDGGSWRDSLPREMDLRRALARLPADQRLLLVLHYYLDLPFAEVAAVVGGSPEAAKSRTFRVLRKLRLSGELIEAAAEVKA